MKQQHCRNILKTTLAASLTCGITPVANAHGDGTSHHIEDLGTTTAVGRRADQTIESTTSKLHSLRADELRDIGIYDVTSALQRLPGVNISSSSQEGTGQGVRVRGLRPNDTQFRIDGVRFTRRLGNLDSFAGQISNTGLSRVELLKGSQSALYGAAANGGVVNLLTKSGGEERLNRLSLEAGSFNSASVEAEYGGAINKLSYYFASRLSTTDNDTYGGNAEIAGYDNDYTSIQSALRLGYNVNKALSVGFTLRTQEGTVETPQFGGSRVENNFYLSTIYANYQVTENWKSKLTVSSLIENTYFRDSSSNTKTEYDQFGLGWENAYQYSGAGTLSFGAEYEHQDYTGFGVTNGLTDHYLAAYVNHAYEFHDCTFETGVRYEDYRSFGNHTSWRTGASYKHDATNTTIKASAATGFNTPNFLQLYSPFAFGIAGNPSLSPETTFGWDLTIEQEITPSHTFAVSFFETDIEKAVTPDFAAGLYSNSIGKRKASGIEASLSGSITQHFDYELNYTWLDRSIDGQPQQTTNAQVEFSPSAKVKLGLGAQYLDQRTYGGSNLHDAFIVRAYGSYQVTEQVKLHARVENLTDTEYSHANFGNDYPARRLGVHVGVTIQW